VKFARALAILLLVVPMTASAQCLLTYQTESIDAFFVGQPANYQIEGVSGTEPYRFTIYEGELPEGLHLTPTGRIVGMPKGEAETVVLITLSDAAGCQITQASRSSCCLDRVTRSAARQRAALSTRPPRCGSSVAPQRAT
jgi:hypothetical protein